MFAPVLKKHGLQTALEYLEAYCDREHYIDPIALMMLLEGFGCAVQRTISPESTSWAVMAELLPYFKKYSEYRPSGSPA